MEYRHLGRSGLMVSELAYGNWITHASQVDDAAAVSCVHAALDAGITTFDTADVYAATEAERVLGKALKGQRRDGLEIFTKVFWPTGPGRNDRGLSRKHITESCNGSLKRIGVDHLDLYQAHRFDHHTPLAETLRAFDDLVRSGKVLYVGVSEWRAEEITAAVELAAQMGLDRIVSNQPQYSALWRVIEADVIPASVEAGIGQIVWSPLAQGVLTGKYLPGAAHPQGSRATSAEGKSFVSGWLRDEVLTAVQDLVPIAKSQNLSLSQLALAWVLQNSNVSSAIIGASRPEQIAENIKAAGITLDPEVMTQINSALSGVAITDPKHTKSPEERP